VIEIDWVQWYLVIFLGIEFILAMYLHDMPRGDKFDIRTWILNTLISIPIIGRIFGWW